VPVFGQRDLDVDCLTRRHGIAATLPVVEHRGQVATADLGRDPVYVPDTLAVDDRSGVDLRGVDAGPNLSRPTRCLRQIPPMASCEPA
jgi:hypothetical protein